MLLAILLAAVQLDSQTGLWFPPYATRTQYLSRDPAHPLMADVHKAFQESPALADEVCSAYLAAPEPPSAEANDPSVRQFRSMFAMMCTSRGAQSRKQQETAQRAPKAIAELQAAFDQSEQQYSKWTKEQRDKRARELVNIVDDGGGQALRPALDAIALSPSDTFGIHSLLALPNDRLADGKMGVNRAEAAAFLEQLYRSRAGDAEYRAGYPAVLLFEGKLDDAKKAADDWYAAAPRERASYARMMQAVIDRAMGREGAFDQIVKGCAPPKSWSGDAADYCKEGAALLVINTLDVQREKAAHTLVDAAFDLERMYFKEDWPVRLALVKNAGFADHAAAQKHFYAMLADPEIPGGAQLDAVHHMATMALEHDKARVAPLVDCWIKLQGVNIAPASAEMWRRFAAMTSQGQRMAECNSGAANTRCIMRMLARRRDAAEGLGNWKLFEQTIEKMASIVVATNSDPTPVRSELMILAEREIYGGRRADAVRVMSFLKSQPQDPFVSKELAHYADAVPAGASQPWQSPADPGMPAGECPPRE